MSDYQKVWREFERNEVTHSAAHYLLAVVAFAHQDLAHAVTEWDRAAELDPDSELGRSAAQFVTLLAADEAPTTPAP